MTTLVLRANPYLLASGQSVAGPISNFGSRVFSIEFFRALLAHGSFEHYRIIGVPPGPAREHLAALEPSPGGRLRFLDHEEIDRIAAMPNPVLAETQAHFLHNRMIRRLLSARREWPITGFAHSLNAQILPIWLLQVVLGDVQPWDALICSSTAGRQVIDRYLDLLPDLFPELRAVLRPLTRIERPVIPLGSAPVAPDDALRHAAREQLGAAPDEVVFLYLGRFSPSSKCDLVPLTAAFAGLAPAIRQRARLVVAGDDTEQRVAASLSKVAADLGCAASTTITANPTDEERARLYAAADVFVSPSDNLQETFGLTIIEAMAAGLPVIASDWSGYRDLVSHGETGHLIPTHWVRPEATLDLLCAKDLPQPYGLDHPAATVVDIGDMRRALALFATDAERRKTMAARAREVFLERYQWKVVIGRYEDLWREMVALANMRAERADDAVARRLTPQRVFAHFPTSTFDDDTPLKPGLMRGHLETLWSWADGAAPGGGSLDAARSIVSECERRAAESRGASLPSIGTVVGWARDAGVETELAARLVVNRLIKYDLLADAGTGLRRTARAGGRERRNAAPPTVAVRLEGGVGDHILGMRILHFVRRRYPEHEIVAYSDSGGHRPQLEIARMSPFVSRVQPISHHRENVTDQGMGWLGNVKKEDLARMHAADVFLDAHGLFCLIPQARALGVPYPKVLARRPELRIPTTANREADELLRAYGSRVYVGLNMAKFGAEVLRRTARQWRMFIDALLEDPNVLILNFYTTDYAFPHWTEEGEARRIRNLRDEAELAAELCAISDRIVPCASLSISTVAALLARCRYFIGVDNGLKHLSWALDVPRTFIVDEEPTFGFMARYMPDINRMLLIDADDQTFARHIDSARRALAGRGRRPTRVHAAHSA